MRKFFGYLIIVSLIVSSLSFCEAKAKKKRSVSVKHKIEFVTSDKFILVGDLYLAQKPSKKPLVVCLHSFSMNSQAWKDLALNLRLKDYNVLAMDLRGHGRSVYNENLKIKSRYYYTSEEWQKLPKDVIESINYIKANYPKINSDEVIIVGADIGIGAGMIASMSMKNTPKKIVLISPMLEFKGLRMPVRSKKFYDTKMLVLLAKTDRMYFNFYTKTMPKVINYPIGGPGNQLIKVNKNAKDDIVNFIIN